MSRPAARVAVLAATALLAVVALSACAPASSPDSPSGPSTGSASAPPTESTAPAAASIDISAEAITVRDAGGAIIESYDYFQPTDEVVAGLTAVLGAPVDTPHPGGLESPPGVEHVWDGLRLYDSDTPGTVPDIPNHWVFVDTATAGGLPIGSAPGIGSADGVQVGDLLSTVTIGVTSGSPYVDPSSGLNTVVSQIGTVSIPPNPATSGERHYSVNVLSDGDTGEIARLNAPAPDFGV